MHTHKTLPLCAQLRQGGMGVVGVSPRYAERVAHKFSQFWRLPPRAVKVRGPHKPPAP